MHVRVQQRNGRKSLTTVQGINPKVDLKKVVKGLKKEFCCNGTVVEDPNFGQVIQLQGDQRQNVQTFLIKEKLATKDNIKVRGAAGAARRTPAGGCSAAGDRHGERLTRGPQIHGF